MAILQVPEFRRIDFRQRNVGHGAAPGRAHIVLARIGLRVGDEFRDRVRWNGWIDYHYIRAAANVRDWRNVADEIEIELFVKRRVYRVRQADKQERIAVGRCPHDGFGTRRPFGSQ